MSFLIPPSVFRIDSIAVPIRSYPARPCPAWHLRSCPVVSGPVWPSSALLGPVWRCPIPFCLVLSCPNFPALSGAVLLDLALRCPARPCPATHDPVWLCSALSCLALLCPTSPSLPCLASTVLSGCVRSRLAFIGPARPCLALPYSTLPCAVLSELSGPVWRCSARSCLTLFGPALSGSVLLYPVWHCPDRPHPALPGAALLYSGWRCLTWPCLALSCPSLSNPAGPVRTFLTLFGTVWSCPVLSDPVRSCLALPGPALSGVTLFPLPGLARPCLALTRSTLSVRTVCSTLSGPVWSVHMMLMVILLWTMQWVSLNCTVLASRARTKKKQWC